MLRERGWCKRGNEGGQKCDGKHWQRALIPHAACSFFFPRWVSHTCSWFRPERTAPHRTGHAPERSRMLVRSSLHLLAALVMPCPGTTAETKAAAPGSGWGLHRATEPTAPAPKMWSPAGGWCGTVTRQTVCCPVAPGRRAWGGSRGPGSVCWGSRSFTARKADAGTCVTGGSRTTCTTSWRDPEPGPSSTTRLCK